MKTKILEKLTTKFEGVSEKVLGRIADNLAKTTTDENIDSVIDGVTFKDVLERYGDSRATEAAETAVANYIKKAGASEPDKGDEGKPKEPTSAEQGSLIDLVKELTKEVKDLKAQTLLQTTKTRTEKIKDLIKDLPETFQKPYLRLNVEGLTEDEFSTLASEIGTDVKTIGEELKTGKSTFGAPRQIKGAKDEAVPESILDAINEKKEGQPF